jgi:hypothetical protein
MSATDALLLALRMQDHICPVLYSVAGEFGVFDAKMEHRDDSGQNSFSRINEGTASFCWDREALTAR